MEIGTNAVVRTEKLKHRRGKLQSKLAKLKTHRKRQNHRKALHRLDEKISRIVSAMHRKSALFLLVIQERLYAQIEFPSMHEAEPKIKVQHGNECSRSAIAWRRQAVTLWKRETRSRIF